MEHQRSDHVILLYGLGGNTLFMRPLANRLRAHGRTVTSWRYPSFRHSIRHHARCLAQFIQELQNDPAVNRIHLVAHSMGAIIVRDMLHQHGGMKKLSRLVMIAPPNHGTKWATVFSPLLRWFIPVLQELTTHPSSTCRQLPESLPIEFGVIAARFDHLVSRSSTQLPSMADYAVLNGTHANILFSRILANQVNFFLDHGHFCRPS